MKHSGLVIFIIILVLVVIFLLHLFRKHFKSLILPNVYLITGAVKSGKTLLSVHLAIKTYKRNLRSYYLRLFFMKLLHREDDCKKPMLYSNIKLARVNFNLLTFDIILNKVRIPNKSVVLIDEASLLADSMLYNDKDINNTLTRFVKLFAHATHGGSLIIDTQNISDLHFSFKRCMNEYLYINKRLKLPFFSILWVREMFYSSENQTMNTTGEDLDLTLRKVLILNTTYKKYDCYCYSSFTDYLDYQVVYDYEKLGIHDDLKCYKLVSFQDYASDINDAMLKHYGTRKEESTDEEAN